MGRYHSTWRKLIHFVDFTERFFTDGIEEDQPVAHSELKQHEVYSCGNHIDLAKFVTKITGAAKPKVRLSREEPVYFILIFSKFDKVENSFRRLEHTGYCAEVHHLTQHVRAVKTQQQNLWELQKE